MTPRRRSILRTTAVAVVAALILGASSFLVYANVTSSAERTPLAEVAADPAIHIDYSRDTVVLTPTADDNGEGLVFIAGAKIEPVAYAYKLSGLVDDGYTVVIVRPFLNFGLFETRPLSAFTSLAPDVTGWFVGGHSLGGVKACMYADSPDVRGLVLFGSYCANDLSDSDIPVVSISGSDDGLSTPAAIQANKKTVPADTTFVEVQGANHASFGDYGVQAGDGTATISSLDMRDAITEAIEGTLG
ncbi:alpha/beta hydrolase [Agreia sp. COWG]|uniref:alpha/beta hydrolase n=1 Tax=Agreia sp. COWG TaxID=2773266 RepID=UPI00192758CA|nr:alpha/beta hydrolase [Agreia sp. COWG]CAD5993684.1 Abhydrolase_5 domain-containing protein [Agreia sp. COWG]